MQLAPGLEVFPICLGGNVFGWSADERQSFAILDAYAEFGGNFIDTADSYSHWVAGHGGGESEEILGRWLSSRSNRANMVIATKVSNHPELMGLSSKNIRAAVENSLRRLRTDYLDIYYAHRDDESVSLEESLIAFDDLVSLGKVRVLGASNFGADRLTAALSFSDQEGLAAFRISQDKYNLLDRGYESGLRSTIYGNGLIECPYESLAAGFLSGKYMKTAHVESVMAPRATRYLDDRGRRVLVALERVAADHRCASTSVALAWLRMQPTVGVPIASASSVDQVAALSVAAELELTGPELDLLDTASGET
jgi:aryl-alcohol dehydrogenase-like predicted oxidoreductase